MDDDYKAHVVTDKLVEAIGALTNAVETQHQCILGLVNMLLEAARRAPLDHASFDILETRAAQYVKTSKQLAKHTRDLITPIREIWRVDS